MKDRQTETKRERETETEEKERRKIERRESVKLLHFQEHLNKEQEEVKNVKIKDFLMWSLH